MMMWEANVCPYCGKDYRQPAPGMMPMAPAKPKSALPIIAGVFSMITGALGLLAAAMLLLLTDYINTLIGGYGFGFDVSGIVMVLALIGILFSAMVLISGIFAAQRSHFGFAIVGAIIGMILVGPFTYWYLGIVFSLIAIILLAVSHKEFS
jgi:hypothetical protein